MSEIEVDDSRDTEVINILMLVEVIVTQTVEVEQGKSQDLEPFTSQNKVAEDGEKLMK